MTSLRIGGYWSFFVFYEFPVIVDAEYPWGEFLFIPMWVALRQKKSAGTPLVAMTNVLIVTTCVLVMVTSHWPGVIFWLLAFTATCVGQCGAATCMMW